MAARNDEGLYAKARSLFISKATMDDFTGWATPRQADAVSSLFDTELANRERSKRERLLRRARFPVVKSLDGYDFSNVRLPDGYALDGLLDLDFVPRAQDLVFYGKTGRGKTHLAIGLGMRAVERGLNVRFHQTAELVLQLGKAKRDGNLDAMLRDIGKADLIILDGSATCRSTSMGPACSTRSSRAATRGGASCSPRTSSSANGARSSRTTSSRPRSSTGLCTTGACSSSPGRAAASARPSCSGGRPLDPCPAPRRKQRNRTERSLTKTEKFS